MRRLRIAAAAALVGFSVGAAAAATQGEFGNECVMGLALGKDIKTDCSVNTVYQSKTYCFGNEQARELFLKKPEEFLLKAQVYYSSRQQ
jgi:YHS domain-containing protein